MGRGFDPRWGHEGVTAQTPGGYPTDPACVTQCTPGVDCHEFRDEKPRQNLLSGEGLRLVGHVPSTCAPPLPEPPAATPVTGRAGLPRDAGV